MIDFDSHPPPAAIRASIAAVITPAAIRVSIAAFITPAAIRVSIAASITPAAIRASIAAFITMPGNWQVARRDGKRGGVLAAS